MNQASDSSPSSEVFDAVVVGSGATGGYAAKKLTEAGMKVALVEAGKAITPKNFTEHQMPWDLPGLGLDESSMEKTRPIQSKCPGCTPYNYSWFVNDIENPYVTEAAKPFLWFRQRVLGGRSLSWGRQTYRMGPLDFKAASHDGYGDDWPITYEEMVPYFEEVEKYVGISGQQENLVQLPDSVFLPAMEMTCGETMLRDRVKQKMNRLITIGRTANITRNHNGRQACHYCGPCNRGCVTRSYYSSTTTTIPDAMSTGRLRLIADAVAASIVMEDGGKARGIRYIDSHSHDEKTVRGKVIVLCASTLESTRLLLNSNIGGASGVLGHYLMDHIFEGGASGEMPITEGRAWAGMPRRPNGIYTPRFRNVTEKKTKGPKGDFIRGYGYQGNCLPQFDLNASGFGIDYKKALHNVRWKATLGLWGECLARKENYVELDKTKKDAWGIPALKINASWSENEKALWHDGVQQAAEMLEISGARNVKPHGEFSVPGACIHEIGTARMGTDPKKSVLNKHNQMWDVENVFVTDGAAWVSSGCANPTLTMMAITVRACDYIANEYAKKMV